MPLKAADIQKRLPDQGKKNCRECGLPTCFAFAMKLATSAITPDKCPYLPQEVRDELLESLAPPIRLVRIGVGENSVEIGEEEVLYRHEKAFHHSPGIGILISDNETDEVICKKIDKVKELEFNRVGNILRANLVAVRFTGDKERYLEIVKRVAKEDIPLVLISYDLDLLFKAQELSFERSPLIYPITQDNIEEAILRIKKTTSPIGVKADGVEGIIPLTLRLREEGIRDIVLDPTPKGLKDMIYNYTLIRRGALKKGIKELGYPIISFPCDMTTNRMEEIILAACGIIKYAGIIILSDFEANTLLPLLVLRQNIFTDPRKPLMVEEKIYEFGAPNEESPVLVTTNFALTYFAVAGEVEGSKIPAYLAIKDTGGLCVLASWATGKFSGDTIASFIKSSGIENRIANKRIIIPGLVARIKGELEDALPGWQVIVGPREASGIPAFLTQIK